MAENRRLATIERILEVAPIENADAIMRARVRGWDVVVKKGEFEVGDLCVYLEVDSLIDVSDERFAFLAPRGVRTDVNGRSGHVLKTARLRGQYSQGLVIPISLVTDEELTRAGAARDEVGADLSEALNVILWEAPIPSSLAGAVRGMRPSWIPATDEERLQNVSAVLNAEANWVATEKIDGTSTTFWSMEGDAGVCSRNLDLLENEGNTLWKMARDLDVFILMTSEWGTSRVAIQGETYGEGIQGNPLRLKGQHFAAFTLRVNGREIPRGEWPQWLRDLSVPVHEMSFPKTLEEALSQVDGMKSLLADRPAEGVVWRALDTDQVNVGGQVLRASFKVISNRYLLKNDR